MFIHRQVLEIEAEIVPEYPKALVRKVVALELSRRGRLRLYVVQEEKDMYTKFLNIYSTMDEDENGVRSLTHFSETAVLCFRTKTVYHKVDREVLTEYHLSTVADVYTHEQLEKMGVNFKDGIPQHMETPYAWV